MRGCQGHRLPIDFKFANLIALIGDERKIETVVSANIKPAILSCTLIRRVNYRLKKPPF